jgi:putative addiction module component (TIGR02574 family)
MSERSTALLAEALKLSEDERAELADQLYASLDEEPDIDSMSDEEFAQELERRHQEFVKDPSVGVPMEEVKRLTRIE